MSHDPANFYARLDSAIQAERSKWSTQIIKPVTDRIMSTTLQALKDKATAAELTLIEAVEAAVQENAFKTARHMVRDAASTYIISHPLHPYSAVREWAQGLGDVIDKATQIPTE